MNNFGLSEMWLVKADNNRTFVGLITRDKKNNLINGVVSVNEGKIFVQGISESDITKKFDQMCILKLDHNIHNITGKYSLLCSQRFFHN